MWEVKNCETIVENRWLTVKKESVKLPSGVCINDFYSVRIPDAAAIVALTEDKHIILKREYKHATGETLIEVPAGMFEPGEIDGIEVAKRELLEETGYVSDNWTYFGDTVECSSKLTNRMHIYLAMNCKKVSNQKLDGTEELDVLVLDIKEAVEMVMRNEIKCNSSAHAILKTARLLGV